jgi:hypothetical protein
MVVFDVARPHQLLDASNAASAWQSRRLGMHIIMLEMTSLLDGQLSRLINGIYSTSMVQTWECMEHVWLIRTTSLFRIHVQ